MTSIELNGCVGPDELPSLARRWFEAAARVLFADVIAGLVDGQVSLPRSRPGVGDASWGEPGSMWAALVRIVSEGSPLVRLGCEFGSFPLGPRNRIAWVTEEDARRLMWEMVQDVPVAPRRLHG